MKQKFVWNLFLIVILNLLIKPFYIIGIDAEVINRVGLTEYGNYFALINLSFLFNIILDCGIINYNTRNIAQHNFLLEKYFSGIITLRLLLVIFYLLTTILLSLLLGYRFYDLKILLLLSFNQIIVAFILYLRSNFSALHYFVTDSIVSILDRFLLIVICSILLWGGLTNSIFKIEWFVFSQTVSYLFTLIICIFLTFKKIKYLKIKLSVPLALVILKKSFPYAALILMMTIYYRSDSIMLDRLIDDNSLQAGIYAQAYRFFEASNMLAYLFAALLLPILSTMLKNRNKINEIIYCSFRIIMVFAISLSIFSIFYSIEIMDLRYDRNLIESSKIFIVLMISFLFVSSTYIFGTLLTANGEMYKLNMVAFFGVILNIFLNFILIPKLFAFGSAIASLFTQSLTGIAQYIICYHIFNFKMKKIFYKIFLFSAILLAVTFILDQYFDSLITVFILYGTFSVLLTVKLKLITLSDFKFIVDNKV
tara:strand:+ start:1478 stop:2917 length:1440 start_codon:yes stop_codon:yes gene_type:complete